MLTVPELIPGFLALQGGRATVFSRMVELILKVAFPEFNRVPDGSYDMCQHRLANTIYHL